MAYLMLLVLAQASHPSLEQLVERSQLIIVATHLTNEQVTENTTRWRKPLSMTLRRHAYRLDSVLFDSQPRKLAPAARLVVVDSADLELSEIGAFNATGACLSSAPPVRYPSSLGPKPYAAKGPVILFLTERDGRTVTVEPDALEAVKIKPAVAELIAKQHR